MLEIEVGRRVRSGASGPTLNRLGTVTTGYSRAREDAEDGYPPKLWIRWDGNFISNGYRFDSEVVECLQNVD